VDSSLTALLAFFSARRERAEPLVLATVVETEGSTYRKPGARMLIDGAGATQGLLSGGCLEGDLAEHARSVLESGSARLVEYDLRSSDDLIWGLGLGCEGAMRILLQRLSSPDGYAPLEEIARAQASRRVLGFATVIRSTLPGWPPGRITWVEDTTGDPVARSLAQHTRDVSQSKHAPGVMQVSSASASLSAFVDRIDLPPRILILGAGPDAAPVVNAAHALGWSITLFDHRPAYAVAAHFPEAEQVVLGPADELSARLDLGSFDAAVVMSHHLIADRAYLQQLAATGLGYVGLLGPAPRRHRLLAELGIVAAELNGRLFGPVGLDIGARSPEAIAVAIIAEIHAVLSGRHGQPYSRPSSAPASA
jgi:xanthine/CO dehydrogenase XdhC/CoxF family maturation factor